MKQSDSFIGDFYDDNLKGLRQKIHKKVDPSIETADSEERKATKFQSPKIPLLLTAKMLAKTISF